MGIVHPLPIQYLRSDMSDENVLAAFRRVFRGHSNVGSGLEIATGGNLIRLFVDDHGLHGTVTLAATPEDAQHYMRFAADLGRMLRQQVQDCLQYSRQCKGSR